MQYKNKENCLTRHCNVWFVPTISCPKIFCDYVMKNISNTKNKM